MMVARSAYAVLIGSRGTRMGFLKSILRRHDGPPTLDPRRAARLPPSPRGWPVLPPGPPRPERVPPEQRAYASTACPWCAAEMSPPPKAKKRCPACGNDVHVRSGPDELRHLLRPDDIAATDERWAAEELARERAELERRAAFLASLGMPRPRRSVDEDDEDWEIDVVGESFHLAELVALLERYPARECVAIVRREPANKYDNQAVEVLIDGVQVGHLSREDARDYQPRLRSWEKKGHAMWAIAELAGGGLGPDGRHSPVGVTLWGLPRIE
jgi:hypothetical protein